MAVGLDDMECDSAELNSLAAPSLQTEDNSEEEEEEEGGRVEFHDHAYIDTGLVAEGSDLMAIQPIVLVSSDGGLLTPSEATLASNSQLGDECMHRVVLVPSSSLVEGASETVATDDNSVVQIKMEPPAFTETTKKAARTTQKQRKPGPKDNVWQQPASNVSQSWFTTKDDKMALQVKGHQWKQGQWSHEEVDLLKTNIAHYCQKRHIEDPASVIFNMSKDERKDFYRTVARGLERPLFSVYRRVVRMYDRKNHLGKYTPEEIKALKELRLKHGSDWATIGTFLGRSASSVKDRCRLMKDCNAGKWLPEEEVRLTQAVYDLSGAPPGDEVTQGLSWALVAERVATRSEKQCRTKWLNYLNWKQKGGVEWTRQDDLTLIRKLSELAVTDDTQVDWAVMAHELQSARSPQWLRGKWWTIKRHVDGYQLMSLPEILDALKSMGLLDVKMVDSTRIKDSSNSPSGKSVHIPVSAVGADDSCGGANQHYIMQTAGQAAVLFQPTNLVGSEHIVVHMLPQMHSDAEGKEHILIQPQQPQEEVCLQLVEQSIISQQLPAPALSSASSSSSSSSSDGHQNLVLDSDPMDMGNVTVVSMPSPSEEEMLASASSAGSSVEFTAVTDVHDDLLLHKMSSLSDPMLAMENADLISMDKSVDIESS